MNPKILVPLADGFEEIEAVCPIDILRRAGAEVCVAAVGDTLTATGKTGIVVQADALLADKKNEAFDALVLPGGPAAQRLREDPAILDLVRSFSGRRKWIGAICAAPTILNRAGVLAGKRYTAHFSAEDELKEIREEPVVRDGHIITSRGAGTAVAFGLALVEALFPAGTAGEVADSICAPTGG